MSKSMALIFGNNKYAYEIFHNVKSSYKRVRLFALNTSNSEENFSKDVEIFDLSDDWQNIEKSINIEESIAFCVLEDMAENIFLTISLRAYFKDLIIIALAHNKESANKLLMAGASKVIPLEETTADIITNMLEKPISNKVLAGILYGESALKIAQIKIAEESRLEEHKISDIDWTRYRGVIILSLIRENMKSTFIYAKELKNYIMSVGDILVVVGYENDIEDFEKIIGSKRVC